MYHCDGHCTLFFSHWCSPPAHHCRGYIDSVCMHRLRASTTLLLPGVMQWETVTGNHSSKSGLKDGCYFPVTEENQTHIHIHIQIQLNYLQIHAMFPYAFCSVIQRPLGFRNEMHLIGFYLKWQYRHSTSSLCLLSTSCQKSEKLATFPLCLDVGLSSTDSTFVIPAGKVKIS